MLVPGAFYRNWMMTFPQSFLGHIESGDLEENDGVHHSYSSIQPFKLPRRFLATQQTVIKYSNHLPLPQIFLFNVVQLHQVHV